MFLTNQPGRKYAGQEMQYDLYTQVKFKVAKSGKRIRDIVTKSENYNNM